MINDLFRLLQKPALWQRSIEPFWDDEHISKGMLEAHLNPDWDAASRKHSFIDNSVKWLSSIIPSGSKVLDIGCGPGLYTKRLSDIGYGVTGMDYSKRSIAYAKSQDSKTEYICKDYLELDYSGVFDAVTLIYCDYAALTLAERHNLLTRVYKALKPGGLFVFDVFDEKTLKDKIDRTWWSTHKNGGFCNPNPHICLNAEYYFENNTVEVGRTIVIAEQKCYEYLNWNTAYSTETLAAEISPFGFQVKGVFDDVCGNPHTGEAETICFVLERGAE